MDQLGDTPRWLPIDIYYHTGDLLWQDPFRKNDINTLGHFYDAVLSH